MTLRRNDREHITTFPNIDYEEGLDQVNLHNYKGMFYGDTDRKYEDPITGAHFEYHDMCHKLLQLQRLRGSDKNSSRHKSEGKPLPRLTNILRKPMNELQALLDRRKERGSRNADRQEHGKAELLGDYRTGVKEFGGSSFGESSRNKSLNQQREGGKCYKKSILGNYVPCIDKKKSYRNLYIFKKL
eukprot:TRINITY_DN1113_c0_g1_i1.p1 TRINITY_DN1113_c0_g1~~TRINITY_DN1113_c0_g1_i1.p1  ORF type:complete len:186 (+),score=25.84 TRINITY_DN1113_c0_g1_i1:102-659(+)